MKNYVLFLKGRFSSQDGNFLDNTVTRHPDNRFWDEVVVEANGDLTPQNNRVNADTRTMEMTARSNNPTDNVYFAVNFTPAAVELKTISFMCGLHPGMKVSKATTAAPFRHNGEIQCNLSSDQFKPITVNGDIFSAIGPYALVKDPGPAQGQSCFYKLTLVATASNGGVTREFSYDPDMDIEVGN